MPNGVWDESKARRSVVTIKKSRVDGAYGAGISVEGSDTHVEATSIGHVHLDRQGRGAGVRVERRWLGNLAAAVTVKNSVISSVQGEGIHLDDVDSAVLAFTTIRDIASVNPVADGAPAASALKGCLGNGVRVRSRAISGVGGDAGVSRSTTLDHLLIDGVGESGVHVEGATATISNTLIRNVRACGSDFGDGIAAYGYSFAAASVDISKTRVTGVTRSAVAAFGARVSLDGSTLQACTALALDRDPRPGTASGPATSLCSCAGKWSRCTSGDAPLTSPLTPALLGFGRCDAHTTACVDTFTTSFGAASAPSIPGVVSWASDRDSVASVSGDNQGRSTFPTPADLDVRWASVAGGYLPIVGLGRAMTAGSLTLPDSTDTAQGNFGAFTGLAIAGSALPDARNGTFVVFQICDPTSGAITSETRVCGGHGVPGARAQLLTATEAPLGEGQFPWAHPYYSSDSGNLPDPNLKGVGRSSTGYFWNVPPGEYLIQILPRSDAASMTCTLDQAVPNTGVHLGWPASGPNRYRAYVEGGVMTVAVRAFCTVP